MENGFSAVGDDWDAYLTNDKEGRFFTSRFELDMPPENDYYDTIEEVAEHIGAYIGRHIEPTKEAIYAAIDEFDETNDGMDAYIFLKVFEVVELNEVLCPPSPRKVQTLLPVRLSRQWRGEPFTLYGDGQLWMIILCGDKYSIEHA